jgi:hypothetical protein
MTQVMAVPDVLILLVALIGVGITGWVWAGLLWVSVRIARGEHYSIEPGIASALFLFVVAAMFGGWWLSVAVRLFGWAREVAR